MSENDSNETVYAVAYSGDRFLMVWNPKRNGWEMPGGHVKIGESYEQAAEREFLEEAGYSIEIVETRDLGYCHVCAAVLKERIEDRPEMKVSLFDNIPEELFFSREEYEDVVPWARSAIDSKKRPVAHL